jgi:hypothetical protein
MISEFRPGPSLYAAAIHHEEEDGKTMVGENQSVRGSVTKELGCALTKSQQRRGGRRAAPRSASARATLAAKNGAGFDADKDGDDDHKRQRVCGKRRCARVGSGSSSGSHGRIADVPPRVRTRDHEIGLGLEPELILQTSTSGRRGCTGDQK